MCIENGIVDEACKQCNEKSKDTIQIGFSTCSDRIVNIDPKCEDIKFRYDEKVFTISLTEKK